MMEYRAVVSRRLASAVSAPDSNATVTASRSPSSRNETITDRMVRIVRVFRRSSAAQSSGRYLTARPSLDQRALVEHDLAAGVLGGLGVVRDHHHRLAVL